jgi:lipid-A-disaccharide synthase-like uncharacterized protein
MDAWKLIGLAGSGLFGLRWVVQFHASRRAGRSLVTPTFWILSVTGSLLALIYFVASPHRDVVGVLGNALPFANALYNLRLVHHRQPQKVICAAADRSSGLD